MLVYQVQGQREQPPMDFQKVCWGSQSEHVAEQCPSIPASERREENM